jgi:hypothetical protein
MDQMTSTERKYVQLSNVVETELVNITGCLLPCSYREFKLAGTPKKQNNGFGLIFQFARTEIVEEKEAYVYGFVSFVSEFGGALGLFLGFSFFMAWELVEPFFLVLYQKTKASFKDAV